jgi:hypothetical protein
MIVSVESISPLTCCRIARVGSISAAFRLAVCLPVPARPCARRCAAHARCVARSRASGDGVGRHRTRSGGRSVEAAKRAAPSTMTVPDTSIHLFWHARVQQDEGNRWLRGIVIHFFADPAKPSHRTTTVRKCPYFTSPTGISPG